jgi:arylamine N-acetyltransferase
VRDYLDFLELPLEPPTLDYLRQLTRSHVSRVPFENITSIFRRVAAGDRPVPPVDVDELLRGWRARAGGGVCFEIAEMFGILLASLGFQTQRVLCLISFPGAHQALVVRLGETSFLVDAGNGAPFFEPIPLCASDPPVEFSYAGLRYRFRAEAPDRWVQDPWIHNTWQPFCTYYLAPVDELVKETAYQRLHTLGQSWVVDRLTVIRCTETDVWTLRGSELTHFTASGKSATQLDSAEVSRVVAEIFGLPNAPVAQALDLLGQRAA